MWNNTYVMDKHSILYIPDEFYVNALFCFWHSASRKWVDIFKTIPIGRGTIN